MSYVFVLTCQKQFVESDIRHKNSIKALNKKHASKELFSFKNFIFHSLIYKEKCGIHKMKKCKRNSINKCIYLIKFTKWKVYFGPLVLAAVKGRIEVLLWR